MCSRVPSSPMTQARQSEEPSGNFSNRSYLWFIGVPFSRPTRFANIVILVWSICPIQLFDGSNQHQAFQPAARFPRLA